jgi:hypothetical protein
VRRAGAIALLVMAASVPWATAADAAPGELRFSFPSSNGYSIAVSGQGATAIVRVGHPTRPPARATAFSAYIARAKVSGGGLRASFGERGRIAVRFRPSGRVRRSRPERGCFGPDHFTSRFGVFVGEVSFEGEDGYTSVHLRRVKGTIVSPLSLDCIAPDLPSPQPTAGQTAPGGRAAKVTQIRASWRLGLRAASFAAIGGSRRATYFAESQESVGSLAVYRFAFALGSPVTFVADDALSLAGVTPPAPFSGSAAFQRDAGGAKSWTGSLAVSFPGAPDTPLTGPQFKTQLVRSW